MKRLSALCLTLLTVGLFLGASDATDPFSIKTALDAPASDQECAISMSSGDVLEFNAHDLELRMGLVEGSLRGVTLITLPQEGQGALFLDGVEVEPYQFLSREEVDELCFVPYESAVTANLTLLPQGHDSISTRLNISILHDNNEPPLIEDVSYNTFQNTPLTGYLQAGDPDGDTVIIKIVTPPSKGDVTIEGQTFYYHPYHNLTGNDGFTVCAVDRFSNYSEEATVEIKIESNRSGFTYLDMSNNPSAYAAIRLHENKVLSGEQVGAACFFRPGNQVNRGEFLVMLLASSGLDENLQPTVNTGLDNDASLPFWIKPYVRKALDEGILIENQSFHAGDVPTRAEAVVMTDRAAKITDVKDFTLTMTDIAEIPSWAMPSYKDLAAYRMLDLYDGYAHPDAALTRDYAADLIWQLWKHYNRS